MSPIDPKDVEIQRARMETEDVRISLGGLMRGKRAVITGVANDRSLAWAIARAFDAEGAELAFTYPGEGMERRVRPLAESLGAKAIVDCDVAKDDDLVRTVEEIRRVWDRVDVLVHSIGYAPREALDGRFTEVTTRDAWRVALDVSAYSLVGLARVFKPLMPAGSSIVSLTYYGSEKVVRNYNVMGVAKAALDSSVKYLAWDLGSKNIRVNAISAGPVRTLAARSIAGFPTMEAIVEERSPLHRHIDADDVGAAAAYLLSDDARNVTGTVLHVDSGYHAMGM